MSTRTECPLYDHCGFVILRQNRPSEHMPPLPENGDCEIEVKKCSRYKYETTEDKKVREQISKICNVVGNVYTNPLPVSHAETIILYPLRPNNNGRPERRLSGGGHR